MVVALLVVVKMLVPHLYWLFGPEGILTELRESI